VQTKIVMIVLLTVAAMLAACSTDPAIDPLTIGDPVKGKELFENSLRGRCAACHDQNGDDIPTGPSLAGIGSEAGKRVTGMSAVEYLEQSILEPSAFLSEGYQDRMKVYRIVVAEEEDYMFADMITEEEMNNLVAFLLTQ
jgi:mono/diheme cytochrome c family protein